MAEKERFKAAVRVLDLDDEIEKCWEQLDYFEETGRLRSEDFPENPIEIPTDKFEAARQAETDKRYILRNKDLPAKADEVEFRRKRRAAILKYLNAV